MQVVTFAVPDPYAINPMCMHRDRQESASGEAPPPFIIYSPSEAPESGVELQFSGDVYQEIKWEGVDDAGRQVAELQIVKFNMTADHPALGRIVISLDPTRPSKPARLEAVNPGQKFPVVHTTWLHVIATIQSQSGMVLQSAGPALEFKSEPLSTWPPQDNIYKLATKVDFEPRLQKGIVVLSSTAGGAIVGS